MPQLLIPLVIAFGVLGAILGSFVGVIAERAFTGQSWMRGRSYCNSCREVLGALDLVPVFSWLVHKGKCRHCGSSVSGVYALYELSLAVAFAATYAVLGLGVPLVLFLAALMVLAFIVIYDLRHTIVPPPASTTLVVLSAAFAAYTTYSLHTLLIHLALAILVALFFFSLYFFSGGRAMGLGDTPVAFALALLVGGQAISGLLFSFWIGAVVGVGILVYRRQGLTMRVEIPFVPFMALGYLLAFFTQWHPLPFYW